MKKLNHPLIASLVAMLLVSACGKNLHVGTKASPQSSVDRGNSGGTLNQVNPSTADDLTDETKQALTSQKIMGWNNKEAKVEFKDLRPVIGTDKAKMPALKLGTGNASTTDGETKEVVNYANAGLIMMSGTVQVPPKAEMIKKVKSLSLIFKGFRMLSPAGGAKNLANQFLCEMDAKVCSGTFDPKSENANKKFWDSVKITSDLFSKIETPNLRETIASDNSQLLTVALAADSDDDTLTVDLIAAFGLDKLSDSDLVNWVMNNSKPYLDPSLNLRRFRFAMGTNVYADSGFISMELDLNKDKLPKDFVSTLANPAVLKKTADANSTPVVDPKKDGAVDDNSTDPNAGAGDQTTNAGDAKKAAADQANGAGANNAGVNNGVNDANAANGPGAKNAVNNASSSTDGNAANPKTVNKKPEVESLDIDADDVK